MGAKGHGKASGAGTIINAIATYKGSAFGIDLWTHATVELGNDFRRIEAETEVKIEDKEANSVDTRLIERCAELVLKKFNLPLCAFVRTKSEISVASGLKSSSAAANAVVVATLDAIGEKEKVNPLEAIRIGVKASLDVGVSITGAFDDASASLLGGIVITDNKKMKIIKRVEKESSVLILVPKRKTFTANTDVKKSRLIAPWVNIAYELALAEKFEEAMTLNGFLYCAALNFEVQPMMKALECGIKGISLSGTGPSFIAFTEKKSEKELYKVWNEFPGRIIKTRINNKQTFSFKCQ